LFWKNPLKQSGGKDIRLLKGGEVTSVARRCVMADLTEKDKRTLLGDNFREVLEQARAEGRAQSASKVVWASQVEKCGGNKLSAVAIMVVGAILFVSNSYAISGPSVLAIGIAGMAAFLAGVGWYLYLWKTLRKLYANRPAN
jgi:hypothetical protein